MGLSLLLLLAGSFSAYSEDKEKLSEKAKKIVIEQKVPENVKQEYVEVRAKAYPGLEFRTQTLADQLVAYDPSQAPKLLTPVDLMQIYNTPDWNRAQTARPYRSQNLVEVKVPVSE